MRHLIKKHKRKIAYTTPFLFFLFFGMNILVVPANDGWVPRESVSLVPVGEKYSPTAGEVFFADVIIATDTPINAVEATISFPTDIIEIADISRDGSIIDLWSKEPSFSNTAGRAAWGGGTLDPGGFTGNGKILNIAFIAKKPGVAEMRFDSALFAAYDGKGTILFPVKNGISYTIRPKSQTSPDLNADGIVNFTDLGIWIAGYFKSYDPRYDLNGDGKVSTSDLSIFLLQ
ncbi:MAG: hypothetical protein HYT94_01935 [Parcubacteria group bacterium]|nr:hypothetical protein [Parcubacteria group bacterium]